MLKQKLKAFFGPDRIHENEILAKHNNWRVGGPADLFIVVHTADELRTAVICAWEHGQPVTILGFGANVLVSDKGIRGLVILNRAQRITFLKNSVIEADSGTSLTVLARKAAQTGISNLEFLIGIPGTVGAAVVVNAGTRTEWISTILTSALVLHQAQTTTWMKPEELFFSYRDSALKRTGKVVITVRLQGRKATPEIVEQNIDQHLKVRKNQPTGASAGSVFTNPQGDFAGRLIETCGLKGYQIGGARVADKHANFILNVGDAKAADIKAVIEHVKAEVLVRFGKSLGEEIRYLGEW